MSPYTYLSPQKHEFTNEKLDFAIVHRSILVDEDENWEFCVATVLSVKIKWRINWTQNLSSIRALDNNNSNFNETSTALASKRLQDEIPDESIAPVHSVNVIMNLRNQKAFFTH